jgi:hypothetical protein
MNTLNDIVEYNADKSKFNLIQEFKKFKIRVYVINNKKYINCEDLRKYNLLIINVCHDGNLKFIYNNIEINYLTEIYQHLQNADITSNGERIVQLINHNGCLLLRPKFKDIYYNFKLKKCIKINNNSFILDTDYEQYIMELNPILRNDFSYISSIKQTFDKLYNINNLLKTIPIKEIELNTNENIIKKYDIIDNEIKLLKEQNKKIIESKDENYKTIINKYNTLNNEIYLLKEENKKNMDSNRDLQLEIHYLKLNSDKNRPNIDYEAIKKRNNSLNKEFKRIYKLTKMKYNS